MLDLAEAAEEPFPGVEHLCREYVLLPVDPEIRKCLRHEILSQLEFTFLGAVEYLSEVAQGLLGVEDFICL